MPGLNLDEKVNYVITTQFSSTILESGQSWELMKVKFKGDFILVNPS